MSTPQKQVPRTTTHVPDDAVSTTRGRPVLLGAFPEWIAVEPPKEAAPIGRDWLRKCGRDDEKVSSNHLLLVQESAGLSVEDAGAKNGVFVNGTRLARPERRLLIDGDLLRIGATLFVYRIAFEGEASPALSEAIACPWGLRGVFSAVRRFAKVRSPTRNILLHGETGTGKEILARIVAREHGRDPVKTPYAHAHLGSGSRDTKEVELFGADGGKATGLESSVGAAQKADKGTLFLDEIEALPASAQPMLLRFLQEHRVSRVGSHTETPVDVLVIAATNEDLECKAKAREFRADLLERFPLRIAVPALRDRAEDLWAILAALYERNYGRPLVSDRITVEAMELLMQHRWPGNARELERFVLSEGLGSEKRIERADVERFFGLPPRGTFPPASRAGPTSPPVASAAADEGTLLPRWADIREALAVSADSPSPTARRLGISIGRLRRLLDAVDELQIGLGVGRAEVFALFEALEGERLLWGERREAIHLRLAKRIAEKDGPAARQHVAQALVEELGISRVRAVALLEQVLNGAR